MISPGGGEGGGGRGAAVTAGNDFLGRLGSVCMDTVGVKKPSGWHDLELLLGRKTFTITPQAHLISTVLALMGKISGYLLHFRAGRCSDGNLREEK